MRKIEHIGIAVKDIEASNQLFEKLLGTPADANDTDMDVDVDVDEDTIIMDTDTVMGP